MSELIQAQGCAGRDGKPAKCFIIPNSNPPKINPPEHLNQDHKGQQYIKDYVYDIQKRQCLQYGLTLYIDNTGTKCVDCKENIHCSICKGMFY